MITKTPFWLPFWPALVLFVAGPLVAVLQRFDAFGLGAFAWWWPPLLSVLVAPALAVGILFGLYRADKIHKETKSADEEQRQGRK